MISCPHCGTVIFDEPEGLGKLSPNQKTIYLMLLENPQRIWTARDIASKLYEFDPLGGPHAIKSIIPRQIWAIRQRLGNVIETTNSGYRLRLQSTEK